MNDLPIGLFEGFFLLSMSKALIVKLFTIMAGAVKIIFMYDVGNRPVGKLRAGDTGTESDLVR